MLKEGLISTKVFPSDINNTCIKRALLRQSAQQRVTGGHLIVVVSKSLLPTIQT